MTQPLSYLQILPQNFGMTYSKEKKSLSALQSKLLLSAKLTSVKWLLLQLCEIDEASLSEQYHC